MDASWAAACIVPTGKSPPSLRALKPPPVPPFAPSEPVMLSPASPPAPSRPTSFSSLPPTTPFTKSPQNSRVSPETSGAAKLFSTPAARSILPPLPLLLVAARSLARFIRCRLLASAHLRLSTASSSLFRVILTLNASPVASRAPSAAFLSLYAETSKLPITPPALSLRHFCLSSSNAPCAF